MVHGGMLKLAQVMGGNGQPVHAAVRAALRRNRGYGKWRFGWILDVLTRLLVELVTSGHSLGAAVAGLLALVCGTS